MEVDRATKRDEQVALAHELAAQTRAQAGMKASERANRKASWTESAPAPAGINNGRPTEEDAPCRGEPTPAACGSVARPKSVTVRTLMQSLDADRKCRAAEQLAATVAERLSTESEVHAAALADRQRRELERAEKFERFQAQQAAYRSRLQQKYDEARRYVCSADAPHASSGCVRGGSAIVPSAVVTFMSGLGQGDARQREVRRRAVLREVSIIPRDDDAIPTLAPSSPASSSLASSATSHHTASCDSAATGPLVTSSALSDVFHDANQRRRAVTTALRGRLQAALAAQVEAKAISARQGKQAALEEDSRRVQADVVAATQLTERERQRQRDMKRDFARDIEQQLRDKTRQYLFEALE